MSVDDWKQTPVPAWDRYNLGYLVTEELKDNSKGIKYDSEKPPIDLVDAEYIEGLADVLGFGARKYDRHNWRNGIAYSRLISAAYRHLGAINRGEDLDPESGKPHVFHLACNTQFLSWMMKHRSDLDDRYKPAS